MLLFSYSYVFGKILLYQFYFVSVGIYVDKQNKINVIIFHEIAMNKKIIKLFLCAFKKKTE